MSAVDSLLRNLDLIDGVIDAISRRKKSADSAERVADDFAFRGVLVQGVSTFEQFLRQRRVEWVAALNAGRVHPQRLPGGTEGISNQIVQLLPKFLESIDDGQRASVVGEVGQTFGTLNRGELIAHEVMFSWPGSNVRASDIEAMFRQLGIKGELSAASRVWKMIDADGSGNRSFATLLESFFRPRHEAAHVANSTPDPIAVGGVTRNVRLASFLVDACVSAAIYRIVRGEGKSDRKFDDVLEGVRLRKVVRDGSRWSERPPGAKRAIARHPSLEVAMELAAPRARSRCELLVVFDGGELVNWVTLV